MELVSGVPRLKFESDFVPPDGSWRVGANATIAIAASGAGPSARLPASAVGSVDGQTQVRVRRGRAFVAVPVTAQREGDAWVIRDGLAQGDLVAASFHPAGGTHEQ